jgi:hypothetical protein
MAYSFDLSFFETVIRAYALFEPTICRLGIRY